MNQQKRIVAITAHLNAPKSSRSGMARSRIDLNKNWLFKEIGPSLVVPEYLPTARFPTDVYADLLYHNIIPDPFRGMNEKGVQWVAERIWEYQTSFETPGDALAAREAVLILEGLDTFARVKLNGEEILQTENMFIRYEIDIKGLLRLEGGNILNITFENPVEKADAAIQRFPNHKWGTMGGEPNRTAVRKAQYHFASRSQAYLENGLLTFDRVGTGAHASSPVVRGSLSVWRHMIIRLWTFTRKLHSVMI
jgi:beta-galactosidase/beta-glucuronidase